MLLSIIIPAYNASGTIDATLQSIESQTIAPSEALRQILADAGVSPDSDFEIIVVDDGSTDDTTAVVRRHISAHPQIRLIPKANGGLSSARNAGMAEAQGEYLHFIDANDLLFDGAYARVIAILAHRRPDIMQFGFRCVPAGDGHNVAVAAKPIDMTITYDGPAVDDSVSRNVWNCIYKRCKVASKICFRKGLLYGEDTQFSLYYYALNPQARKIRVSADVYIYVQYADSLFHTRDARHNRMSVERMLESYGEIAAVAKSCDTAARRQAGELLSVLSTETVVRVLRCPNTLATNRRFIKAIKQLGLLDNILSKKVRVIARAILLNGYILSAEQRLFPTMHRAALWLYNKLLG